ncbi:HlyC/CorC family transporter (plasmid) [Phormidium sp. CLA17]|uniref:hemolysin family protein n=1 Tax=Leptolyngbya sp. Cla-17 TaxID=2803751 RepID=UPI00149198EB|nr:hemolysin family protein [Leptolyngbya sp. Cla-17]MBM0745707.1 HlyC/CorC family transporter [Leptolyngbya sp. Cla-17]
MSSIAFEIVLILLLTIANGIFSGSEIAVVSARKVRLEQLANRGNKKARLALKLANSPNDFLSAVQIGITLIGILSGALGGATLSTRLGDFFKSITWLAAYSETLSLLVVVSIITYLSLVIGELLPKRIALNNPEQIACNIAGPMRLLAIITAPVVKLLSVSTDSLLKLLGIQASNEPAITEEEIKVLIEQGTQAGTFEESEQEMVSRVFRLGDRSIKSLMTPRTAIAWLDIAAPWEENQREIQEQPHSHYPVARDSLDDCLGIVRMKDILSTYMVGEPADLQRLLQPPLYIPEGSRALNVLETFQETGTHAALVIDEYGGIEGMVTIDDLIEAIVGELPSAEEINEPQIVQREDGSWFLDGLLSSDALKDLLERETLPNEAEGHYHTLGGFIIAMLGRIPTSGNHFDAVGFRFEVVDMDGTRVDKVLITPLASEAAAAVNQLDSDT